MSINFNKFKIIQKKKSKNIQMIEEYFGFWQNGKKNGEGGFTT